MVLVLDDYHVIDAREVQDGMAFTTGMTAAGTSPAYQDGTV